MTLIPLCNSHVRRGHRIKDDRMENSIKGIQILGMSTFRFFCERTFRCFWSLRKKKIFRFVF